LQFNRIKLSLRAQHLYGQIKHRTGLGSNISARYGLCLSLKDFSIPNPDEYDERGMEILPSILFGEHEQIYLGLMKNRLKKDSKDNSELNEMTRAHLNRGVISLSDRINGLGNFYKLIKEK